MHPTLSDETLARLPVFPLPGVVLFPGMILPLHVFEPRYRALVEACLAGDRALGVPLLRPGYEADYEGRPPVHAVMGAGVIVAHERLPDGRWNILVRGTDRVRLEHELPADAPFRRFRTARLGEDRRGLTEDCGEALQTMLRAIGERVPEAREPLTLLLEGTKDPARLADFVAAQMLGEPELRQSLLEETDTARRLARVTEAVGELYLKMAGTECPGELN